MEGWVEKRFQQRKERLLHEQHQEQLAANARAGYDSMCSALMDQVRTDVVTYNRLFAEIQDCMAVFTQMANGFKVIRGDQSITVRKELGSTVVKIERGLVASIGAFPTHDSIELAADQNGHLRFKRTNGGGVLPDFSDASEFILGSILFA